MLIFFLILLFCALGAQWLSLRQPLDQVTCQISPSKNTVEPEESFEILTELTNRRRFPIPFLRMQAKFPAAIKLADPQLELQLRPEQGDLSLVSTLYLLPRQRLQRRQKACLPRRGRYFFRGATLYCGDFLGFRESSRRFGQSAEIVVLPAPCQQALPLETLGGFLGDISVNRFIMEDPVLTLGFRDYTGREPQKAISWVQSARLGRLMVKNYDYTLELSAMVILNVECIPGAASIAQLIEPCFSLARSVCQSLENKGIQYGFLTNATAAGAMGCWSMLEEGLGSRHYYTILEGLGRATYDKTESFESLLHRAGKRSQQGQQSQAYLVITPREAPSATSWLNRLKDISGGQICLLVPQD